MSFISDQVSCQLPGQQTPATCPLNHAKPGPLPSSAEVYDCDFSLLKILDLVLSSWAGEGFSTCQCKMGKNRVPSAQGAY